jgi:thiamine biosynthesis lipoprotein
LTRLRWWISGESALDGNSAGNEQMGMRLHRRRFVSMGCPCEIGVFGADPDTVGAVIDEAESEVHRLDQKYSHFRRDSLISRIQIDAQRPGGVEVDNETASLLDYAATQFKISNGLFDITAGQLTRLWHQRDTLPSQAELSGTLNSTGWAKLRWQSPRLYMPKGMQLELGGLVKEYAADRAALKLKRRGKHSTFVELGGDIHVTGPRPAGRPWTMGIRNPGYRQQQSGNALADIPVFSGGLATSGDYERVSRIGGKPYGHIINPRTGWPVDTFQSVSVLAPSCLVAGSFATLAMLMGREKGLNMLSECGFAWLARTRDGTDYSGSSYDQPSTCQYS